MIRNRTGRGLLAAGVFGAGLWVGTLNAAEFQVPAVEPVLSFALDIGLGRSDNLNRLPESEITENIATAGLDLSIKRTSRRLSADLVGDLRYYEYLGDTYDSELGGRFDGAVAFGLMPDRLNWVIEDSYGQAAVDIFSVQTPANREGINYFSTGPEIVFNLGSSGFGRVFGRYALVSYEVAPLDGDRRQVGLSVGRRLSNRGSVSANFVGERLAYDDPSINQGYDRKQAYVRYENQGARTRVSLDLGYTRVEDVSYTDGGESVQLDVSRTISAATTVTLSAGTRVTDASDRFRMAGVGSASNIYQTSVVAATPEVFENRYARAAWQFARNRTSVGIDVFWSDDVYERASILDRERTGAGITVGRQATRNLSLSVLGGYWSDKFDDSSRDFSEWQIGARSRLLLGRAAFVSLDVDHYARTTEDSRLEFTENRAFLTIGYQSQ